MLFGKLDLELYYILWFMFGLNLMFLYFKKCLNCNVEFFRFKYLKKNYFKTLSVLDKGDLCPNCGKDPFKKPNRDPDQGHEMNKL